MIRLDGGAASGPCSELCNVGSTGLLYFCADQLMEGEGESKRIKEVDVGDKNTKHGEKGKK